MSHNSRKDTKSSGKPQKSKPPVSEPETDEVSIVNTSSYRATQSKNNVIEAHVETGKNTIPTAGTSSYRSNQSKRKKVNTAHVESGTDAIPTANMSSHRTNQIKKNVNLIHIETGTGAIPSVDISSHRANRNKKNVSVFHVDAVINCSKFKSISKKMFTGYITRDHTNYGPKSSAVRRRILPLISEELKSSTLPLSVDNKYHIADNIGNNWIRLARMLPDVDFSEGQLENLQRRSEDQTELVVNILNKWFQAAPKTATVGNIAKTLEKMKLNDLAMGLETK